MRRGRADEEQKPPMNTDRHSQRDLRLRLGKDRRMINGWLSDALRFGREVPQSLTRAMRYAVLGPGKRIRPILVLESFRAAGGKDDGWIVPFCCGIEMIHAFSLVHDDLPSMDNDDFRRGRPAVHRKFGEATAILAADALFAYAFRLFCSSPAPAGRRLKAIEVISLAAGPAGMAGGQLLDITANRRTSGRTLDRVQRMKTADFLAASVVCGGIIGGARQGVQDRLLEAGLLLGALFQMTDDLLDAGGTEDDDKVTVVSARGREAVRRSAAAKTRQAEQVLSALGRRYEVLAGFPRLILGRTS